MTLTIKITREVRDANYYSPSKTETFVDVEDVDLGSPSLTGKYLRSLADEIDPPKAMANPTTFTHNAAALR